MTTTNQNELEALRSELRRLDMNGYLTLEDDELNDASILREAIRTIKGEPSRGQLCDRIAHEFTKLLKEALTPAQWVEMVGKNAVEPDNRICASHDYCDANMVMAEAWEKVVGRETDLQSNADTALWGAAWDEAKRIWQAEAGVAHSLRPGKVRMVGVKGEFDCYLVKGENWNGYACPWFTREQATAMLSALKRDGALEVLEMPDNGNFITQTTGSGPEGREEWFANHTFSGLPYLYAIGSGAWCWIGRITAPAPITVREMTDEDCRDYAVDRADYPNDRLWLAIWADRSGYYTEGKDSPPDEARYCATVLNESEIFATSEEAQAWLWARVEVNTPPVVSIASLCAKYGFFETNKDDGDTALRFNFRHDRKDYALLTNCDGTRSPDRVDAECVLGFYNGKPEAEGDDAMVTLLCPDVETAMKIAAMREDY